MSTYYQVEFAIAGQVFTSRPLWTIDDVLMFTTDLPGKFLIFKKTSNHVYIKDEIINKQEQKIANT